MRVRVGDVRLHVTVHGDEWAGGARRPVVVGLHGGPGLDAGLLRHTLAPAAAWAQVVVPDQRGHGRSDYSAPEHWNLDTWADDVAALCDVLGLERPLVVGTSFGGFVAQRYLGRHPDQPGGVVVIGSSARVATREEAVERFRELGGDEAAAVHDRDVREQSAESAAVWDRTCAPLLALTPPDPEVTRVRAAQVRTLDVNLHFLPRVEELDLRADLARARCPVLVMVGERDPLVPAHLAEETVAALPSGLGRLAVVPGSSHTVLLDRPDEGHRLIREFAASLEAPSALFALQAPVADLGQMKDEILRGATP